jgi:hypothetical protein
MKYVYTRIKQNNARRACIYQNKGNKTENLKINKKGIDNKLSGASHD